MLPPYRVPNGFQKEGVNAWPKCRPGTRTRAWATSLEGDVYSFVGVRIADMGFGYTNRFDGAVPEG